MVKAARPTRSDYYRALADNLPAEGLVVTSLGNASYLWAALHHAPENFYLEDAMGLALPLALGLSVAQPRRPVIVVEGDGQGTEAPRLQIRGSDDRLCVDAGHRDGRRSHRLLLGARGRLIRTPGRP